MNFRNLLIPLGLATGMVLIFRYFFTERIAQPAGIKLESGTDRLAPSAVEDQLSKDAHRRLNFEVDFIDDEAAPVVQTKVETDVARYTFSSAGATLESAEIKHEVNGQPQQVVWLDLIKSQAREDRCFLLALEKKTPYYYRLVEQLQNQVDQKQQACDILTYQADITDGVLLKRYYIYKQLCRIDLEIAIKFDQAIATPQPVRLRLFMPAPQTTDARDLVKGLFNRGALLQKRDQAKLSGSYWLLPVVFGAETHYFINSLVKDVNQFAQRGYFMLVGPLSATAVLETAQWSQSQQFRLSFYLGPKTVTTIAAVAPELEQTLEYGFLAPLTKVFFQVLHFFRGYTHSYGWAIVFLALLIKLLLLPLTLRAERVKQSPKQEQEYQRKLRYIQQKYQHDREALLQAQTELMRKYALPGNFLTGMLPILLQLPVFIALRGVLSNSIELYQAPFFWIPNLTAQDPYYILPLCLTLGALFQFSSTRSSEPRQRIVGIVMAALLGIFISGFSAGLVLYLLVN
ncbi:MAG TPA: YidC/Oxa1 family insertase periplasmic-domain containing protein, partial [Candidatus Babeliales bacterium]|nr:YidC/Oxa1 family insertase periplasmic-domain containing protein [Candidatus Babeliales bacterium]